jgi:hypothetical protein
VAEVDGWWHYTFSGASKVSSAEARDEQGNGENGEGRSAGSTCGRGVALSSRRTLALAVTLIVPLLAATTCITTNVPSPTCVPTDTPPATSRSTPEIVTVQVRRECPAVLTVEMVRVVDQHGYPIAGVQITVTNKHTGHVYEIPQRWDTRGLYGVFSNRFSDEINPSGEEIIVSGWKDGLSFEDEFVFGTDEARRGIRRIAGPDTIVLPEQP